MRILLPVRGRDVPPSISAAHVQCLRWCKTEQAGCLPAADLHCCFLTDIILYYSLLYGSLLIVNSRNRLRHRRRHTSAWEHILEFCVEGMSVSPDLTVNGCFNMCIVYTMTSIQVAKVSCFAHVLCNSCTESFRDR